MNGSRGYDYDALRRDYPLPQVVGSIVKLQKSGSEWKACCPLHDDRTPSFTIYEGGQRFFCFGCQAGGDVVDFVSAYRGVPIGEAARSLQGEAPLPRHGRTYTPRDNRDERDKRDRREEARDIWLRSKEPAGTDVETYLKSRGIRIVIPPCLRFSMLRYGKSGQMHPCLVALVRGSNGSGQAIQRTFLKGGGLGKAHVPKPKLSLGPISGGSIRLAEAGPDLVLCEGLEDGLSLLQEHGLPVWVAAGTSNLGKVELPEVVSRIWIAGDNDPAGQNAANRAADRYSGLGLSVKTVFPEPRFKDFNEQLQKGGRA